MNTSYKLLELQNMKWLYKWINEQINQFSLINSISMYGLILSSSLQET